ncbi:MAG TPA: hypothetical protein VGD91_09490, partial [Trebonia sp.]
TAGGFEVPGVGQVELAREIYWEPGGTLYLRGPGDGRVWRVDVPVAVRPATPEETKTALQRERDRTAGLRRQLEASERRIDSLQAELRALAAAGTRRSSRCWTGWESGQSPRHEIRPGRQPAPEPGRVSELASIRGSDPESHGWRFRTSTEPLPSSVT